VFSKFVLRSGEIPGSDGDHNKLIAFEFNRLKTKGLKPDGSLALQCDYSEKRRGHH
jgi:hypothetical protein